MHGKLAILLRDAEVTLTEVDDDQMTAASEALRRAKEIRSLLLAKLNDVNQLWKHALAQDPTATGVIN